MTNVSNDVSNLVETTCNLRMHVSSGELTKKQAEKAQHIKFNLLDEDVILFLQCNPLNLETILRVEYATCTDPKFVECFEVTTRNGRKRIYGWNGNEEQPEFELVEKSRMDENVNNRIKKKKPMNLPQHSCCRRANLLKKFL